MAEPLAGQARQRVREFRQPGLQLALARARPDVEDAYDQARAVGHYHAEFFAQVALLRGCKVVVEDHRPGAGLGRQGFELRHFPRAHQRGRVPLGQAHPHLYDGLDAGGLGKAPQLVQGGLPPGRLACAFKFGAYKYGFHALSIFSARAAGS